MHLMLLSFKTSEVHKHTNTQAQLHADTQLHNTSYAVHATRQNTDTHRHSQTHTHLHTHTHYRTPMVLGPCQWAGLASGPLYRLTKCLSGWILEPVPFSRSQPNHPDQSAAAVSNSHMIPSFVSIIYS